MLKRIFKNIDWKYGLLTICLFSASICAKVFSSDILAAIKRLFEVDNLNLYAGAIATIFTLTHKIKTRKLVLSSSMSFTEFRIPVEDLLSFVGNPITLSCSISLAKGLFFQTSEGIQYFPFFQSLELGFIFLVTAYLFFISIMELQRNIKETLLNNSAGSENVTAISESEITKQIPEPKR